MTSSEKKKLHELAHEVKQMLEMTNERRDVVYGEVGWKLLVLRYIERVELMMMFDK
jgi:hypothetical protein